jgi:hypothetical protein
MAFIDRLRRAGVVVATTVALILGGVALAPAATAAPAARPGYSHADHDRNGYNSYNRYNRYKKVCKVFWKKVGHGKYRHWKKVRVCYYVPVHRRSW